MLTLPLYPIAYSLISTSIARPAATSIDIPLFGAVALDSLALLAILVVLAPYIVAIVTKIIWLQKPETKDKSVIWAFTKQTDHVTTEQLIREDEATSVEFNAIFDRLVEDVKLKKHQLIIVLDNLDRLANDQIREIWATMRNFFAATPGSKRKQVLKNVWLVVPIDRQHIEAVFADSGESQPGTEKLTTTRGFIEKTFEVVLRVPPPLLSNWRSFLERTLKQSFGKKITENDTYRIFRLFEIFYTVRPIVITPRAIKAYVNKIVAQAKLSGNFIPLEYQSLFVLYQEDIAKNLKGLQDSTLLDPAVNASISGTDWTKYLAAAHFNARPEDALEILLSPEIEKALLERNSDRLADLKKTGGFGSVLHNLVASKATAWAQENGTTLLEIAATLDKVELGDAALSDHIWRDFEANIVKIQKPIVPSPLAAEGIQAFVRRSSNERLALQLKVALENPRSEFPEGAQEAGRSWFRLLSGLINPLEQKLPKEKFQSFISKIRLTGDTQYLFGIAEAVDDSPILTLQNFSFSNAPELIANAVVAEVQIPILSPYLGKVISSFLRIQSAVNWTPITESIRTRLQTNLPPLDASTALQLLVIFRSIARYLPSAIEARKVLAKDGTLHGVLEIGRKENNTSLIGLVAYDLSLLLGANITGPAEHPQYGPLRRQTSICRNCSQTRQLNLSLLMRLQILPCSGGRRRHFWD